MQKDKDEEMMKEKLEKKETDRGDFKVHKEKQIGRAHV